MAKVPIKLVSWDEIVEWARALAMRIMESNWYPDIVVAVARGGYAPARLICDFLGVADLVSVQVVHWPSTAQVAERAFIKYPLGLDLSGKRVLVMDDIVDTGDSLQLAKEHIEASSKGVEVRTAALQWISPVAKFKPHYWAIEVKDWTWFVYPWNVTEDVTNFMRRVMVEEYRASGKRTWTLSELIRKMVEWYGDEILKVRVTYVDLALNQLERIGFITRSLKDGVEVMALNA